MNVLGTASRLIPDALLSRMLPAGRSFDPAALPPTASFPEGAAARVLIGPENAAGQGEAWARAIRDNLPSTAAEAFAVDRGAVFEHEVGLAVAPPVFAWSGRWQAAHRRAIAGSVSHVLLEGGRPLLAGGVRGDVQRDLRWLRDRGIGAALVWHGSDVRNGDRHAAVHPLSPYADPAWPAASSLRVTAARNRALAVASGLPSLVSTPDLLVDVPGSRWLPLVVDPERWLSTAAPLAHGGRLRVVHAPSNGVVKGSDLIEPVVRALADEGVIEYRRIEGVAHSEMPTVLREADLVLEQFRLGSYGVAAVEALAAGRIVIGDLDAGVREAARRATGLAPPMLSASPGRLDALIRRIAEDPAEALALASTGPRFVAEVHDGRRSAAVIAETLGLPLGADSAR